MVGKGAGSTVKPLSAENTRTYRLSED
jgi:hypothetical protein